MMASAADRLWRRPSRHPGAGKATASAAAAARAFTLCCTFFLLALLTGCRKRVQTAAAPPPPPLGRSNSGIPARRTLPNTSHLPATIDNGEATVTVGRIDSGVASWYAPSGQRSSNGDMYDGTELTAAHRTLPLGTLVRVTNLATGQAIVVRITDRGPFVPGRTLDLSITAAKAIGVYRMGVAEIHLQVLQLRPGVSSAGRWCVQVGAFLQGSSADRMRAQLTRQYNGTARVIEFQGATGMWVRINPLTGTRGTALAIARSVVSTEADAQAYLVRLD